MERKKVFLIEKKNFQVKDEVLLISQLIKSGLFKVLQKRKNAINTQLNKI